MRSAALWMLLGSLLTAGAVEPAAHASSSLSPTTTSALSFRQHPGARLPLDTEFQDSRGEPVRLGRFFSGKPVVLVLEYLRCRTLCGRVVHDAAQALARTPLAAGRDYQVVAISIDPREGAADARAAEAKYLAGASEAQQQGWHFLTGTSAAIHTVADAVGFPFRYDARIDQYAHPAGITIATAEGTITRYILGVGYRPLDVRLALVEAGRGHISSPVADLLLLCYCYDPGTGRYSFAIANATRALCGATVLGLAIMVVRLSRPRES